jgi:hypothetical protein
MHTNSKLQQAFNRTSLASLGYTLESALRTPALAICLNRLAELNAKKQSIKPAKTYWYQNI